jgi:hypothetical protein
MLVPLFFCSGGCGGINSTQSVSPASFFLPGLLRADPATNNAPVAVVEKPLELTTVR